MTLDQITAITTKRLPANIYLETAMDDHDGIVMVLGTKLPNDDPAIASLYFSHLQLTEARFPELFLASRVDETIAGLQRYAASFVPAPKWDDMQWAP